MPRHRKRIRHRHSAGGRISCPRALCRPGCGTICAKLSLYDGIGHAPFWEDTARFNAELAAFVRAANKTN
jgi:pimeloyl-ACP methyl ester carboxylesterase